MSRTTSVPNFIIIIKKQQLIHSKQTALITTDILIKQKGMNQYRTEHTRGIIVMGEQWGK